MNDLRGNDLRSLVDPEIAPLIDALPLIDLSPETLAEARRKSAVDERTFDQRLVPQEVRIEGPTGEKLRALLFQPVAGEDLRGAILHLHGGGMVFGSADMARLFAPQIVLHHRVLVLSVDYRLAPETPFPGQIEDAELAFHWLRDHADDLGFATKCIFLMGESAGGGLAAGFAMKLRDCEAPPPAGLLLTYPMLDSRTGSPSDPYKHGGAGQFIWTSERNSFGWSALAGEHPIAPSRIGWFSPARANRFDGLPPTFLATGELDLFRAENERFVRQLRDAGVPCDFHCYARAIHGFDLLRRSRLASTYRSDLDAWLENMLGATNPVYGRTRNVQPSRGELATGLDHLSRR